MASWFSTQYHVIESSVQTIAELENNLRELETLYRESLGKGPRNTTASPAESYIDGIIVSHEFTDHCHRATLKEVNHTTPVFATEKAADLIRSWGYFDTVITIPVFSPATADWKKTSVPPLPAYVGISRLVTEGDGLYYHSAIMIAFKLQQSKQKCAEAVFYSPHGIKAGDLRYIAQAHPPIKALAMLHGLHDVGLRMAKQLNLGAHNGLQAVRMCRARYWVGTHDEVKRPRGLIAPFLRRAKLTTEDALRREFEATKGSDSDDAEAILRDIHFSNLATGESIVLQLAGD